MIPRRRCIVAAGAVAAAHIRPGSPSAPVFRSCPALGLSAKPGSAVERRSGPSGYPDTPPIRLVAPVRVPAARRAVSGARLPPPSSGVGPRLQPDPASGFHDSGPVAAAAPTVQHGLAAMLVRQLCRRGSFAGRAAAAVAPRLAGIGQRVADCIGAARNIEDRGSQNGTSSSTSGGRPSNADGPCGGWRRSCPLRPPCLPPDGRGERGPRIASQRTVQPSRASPSRVV